MPVHSVIPSGALKHTCRFFRPLYCLAWTSSSYTFAPLVEDTRHVNNRIESHNLQYYSSAGLIWRGKSCWNLRHYRFCCHLYPGCYFGYRMPWRIEGAGGHWWKQSNVLELLKYTGGIFIVMLFISNQEVLDLERCYRLELHEKVRLSSISFNLRTSSSVDPLHL